MSKTEHIWGIIGAGNMASAMLQGALEANVLAPGQIIASRRDPVRRSALQERFGINTTGDNAALISSSTYILLAIKPQQAHDFFLEFRDCFTAGQTVVSVLAGLTTPRLRSLLPEGVRVVRTMPNTPSLVGRGITLTTGDELPAAVMQFLNASSQVVPLPEEQMDRATAISGCGPAYIFLVAEALTHAGQSLGLDVELAKRLAYETISGSAYLLAQESERHDASELRAQVTSPGGATAAAIEVLKTRGIEAMFTDALRAAATRAEELGA